MESQLENLRKLREQIECIVEGDRKNIEGTTIIISNHNCLKDIFYLPCALEKKYVSLISARLLYKKEKERQELVDKYLYGMPVEAHGGGKYASLCLDAAIPFLENNFSINLFPEGAYIDDKETVYRGRTGAARILFEAKRKGIPVTMVPVAINVVQEEENLDSYNFLKGDFVSIKILEPIQDEEYYYGYSHSTTYQEKNENLHQVVDEGMNKIALALDRKYDNTYIELFPKGNVIFSNGEKVDTDIAQQEQYVLRYQNQLTRRSKLLIKTLKR